MCPGAGSEAIKRRSEGSTYPEGAEQARRGIGASRVSLEGRKGYVTSGPWAMLACGASVDLDGVQE
eukprot:555771-Rhodomonas_salina.1